MTWVNFDSVVGEHHVLGIAVHRVVTDTASVMSGS